MNPSQSAPAQAELSYPGPLAKGFRGPGVKRVQEWLSLHGFGTAVDSEFGSATAQALTAFQNSVGLPATGTLEQTTWNRLVAPMMKALNDGTASELPSRAQQVAAQHLAAKAREVGGDNCGPWVRLYTGGHEGAEWKWCAGFVTFVLKQATLELQMPMPVPGSLSCDSLAAQGANNGLLIHGAQLEAGKSWSTVGPSFIFLVRRTDTDWSHTGFGFGGTPDHFDTIEGNTNDDGSANGYEVAGRVRSAQGKDFIVVR